MKTNLLLTCRRRRLLFAFSLAEMLIASGISVMVFTVGALSYQTITAQQRRSTTYGAITIGNAAAVNYYGKDDTVTAIDAYFAPNYGRGTTADLMRDTFYGDLKNATAVYCLGRDGLTSLRPSAITLQSPATAKSIDTPEAFRAVLELAEPLLVGVHEPYTGVSDANNLSIYVVQSSFQNLFPNGLIISAIYEIDIQSVTNPRGTYATVRRYSFSSLTDVYDVFYPNELGGVTPFNPLVVNFERKVRVVDGLDDGFNRFRVAEREPFYFVWWPDPSVPSLDFNSYKTEPITYSSDDPRKDYYHMGGRTSYMFTFPMFPAL
jgi:hypothetical protein